MNRRALLRAIPALPLAVAAIATGGTVAGVALLGSSSAVHSSTWALYSAGLVSRTTFLEQWGLTDADLACWDNAA